MNLQSKIISVLSVLLLVAIASAIIQMNKANAAQADLDRISNEQRIDEPYKLALAASQEKVKELEKDLAEKNIEADSLRVSLEGHEEEIARLGDEYNQLFENRPNLDEIDGRYKNADVSGICNDFNRLDIPCEVVGRE